LKNIEPKALLGTLRGIFLGEAPVSRVMAAQLLVEFTRHAQELAGTARIGGEVTPREKEVLELLTRGQSNKGIAAALAISENTVKNHLKNILEKLHLENRVQAAAFALRQGLVTRPPDDPR
jgi:two-component system, NarL family, nitrate/nitrite response regulator NarL